MATPSAHRLDEIDHRIVQLLAEDARRTIADISTHVNLSSAPVKRRIDRLEELGVIAGYTVVLDHSKLGSSFEAFVELRIDGDSDIEDVIDAMTTIAEVREIFTTAGDLDALVRILVEDVAHLVRVINQMRRTPHVAGTKSLVVLGRWGRSVRAGP